VVPAVNSTTRMAVEGFAVSPSGHVWIGYIVSDGASNYDTGYYNITLCTATDGTWSAYAGYPKKLLQLNGTLMEGLVESWQDYYAYMILNPSSTAVIKYTVQAIKISNNVPQLMENISRGFTSEARAFSVCMDNSSNIHVVYNNYSYFIEYSKWNTTSWNVQSEYVGLGTLNSYPVVAAHQTASINETYVNWVTNADISLNVRNSSGWKGVERVWHLQGQVAATDPNHINPKVYDDIMFVLELYNSSSASHELWSYIYIVTKVTSLVTGWNRFDSFDLDVGKTMLQVSQSLTFNSLSWTHVVFQYVNTTRVEYINGFGGDEDAVITGDGNFFVYVTVEGVWSHTYP